MPDQHGFGNNGADSAWLWQSGYGDDQTNHQGHKVARPGNRIKPSRRTELRPIWQFAMDRLAFEAYYNGHGVHASLGGRSYS